MEKRKTPVSTVIFYIIGIILLIVSAFMLWTAVNYTKTYLSTYDASFEDMWTNTVQYVIAQFLPYFGMGAICIGLGRAIKGTAPFKTPKTVDAAAEEEAKATDAADAAEVEADDAADVKAAETVAPAAAAAGAEAGVISESQLEDLIRRIDTNREVLSIKIEEKEKRDSFRIKELERKVDGFLSDVKYINEPLEELVYKQAAGIDDLEETPVEAEAAAEETEAEATAKTGVVQKAASLIPQIFRMARNMTMPTCAAEAEETAAVADAAPQAAGVVPQIFTVSRRMTAPVCVPTAAEEAAAEAVDAAPQEVGAVPQIFRVARNMTAPACPAVEAAEAAADTAAEAGAVPPVFRVARTMTMTV